MNARQAREGGRGSDGQNWKWPHGNNEEAAERERERERDGEI